MKLSLRRETLLNLEASDLGAVRGGADGPDPARQTSTVGSALTSKTGECGAPSKGYTLCACPPPTGTYVPGPTSGCPTRTGGTVTEP